MLPVTGAPKRAGQRLSVNNCTLAIKGVPARYHTHICYTHWQTGK